MPHYGGGAEKCARCSKNVYLAEKKVGAGRVCIAHIPRSIITFSSLSSRFIRAALVVKHAIVN